MTGDIAIIFDQEMGQGDWQLLSDGMLLEAPPIHTAVLVSLFTDRRAAGDDVLPPGQTDPRGWWAEQLDDKPIGSRLWLLRRRRRDGETLKLARDYMQEALAWLVTDGLAQAVEVRAEWQARSRIAAWITVRRRSGPRIIVAAQWAWEGA